MEFLTDPAEQTHWAVSSFAQMWRKVLPVPGVRFLVKLKSSAMSLEVTDTNSHVMSVLKNVVFHFPYLQ